MPVYASEDFSFYGYKKPAAFFFLGTKVQENQPFLHKINYDFND
jgi:metal-dependent amidase/aminoacylase/carboxypeptidase family protein